MGMDLSGGYGAAAAGQSLENLLAQRFAAKRYADQQQQQAFENALATRAADRADQQLQETAALKRQMELDRQQRDQDLADARLENATTRQIGVMPRGVLVSPSDYQRFNKFGYGPLFEHQDAQPGMEPGFVGPMPEGQSATPTPDGFRFRGTSAQDLADERIGAQRDIAAARADAAAARDEERATARNWALDLRERNLQRLQDQWNQTHPADNPKFPNGVRDYVVQLRSKYANDLPSAEAEFGRALPQLRAAHPNLDATQALNALRLSFGSAPGASKSEQLIQDLLRGTAGGPMTAGAIRTTGAPSPSGGMLRTGTPAAGGGAASTLGPAIAHGMTFA